MWIAIVVVAFLVGLITAILLLPVYVIVKSDDNGEPKILYRVLWKTFGEKPSSDNAFMRALKKTTGMDKLKQKKTIKEAKDTNPITTITQNLNIVTDLLEEAKELLGHCTMTKLELDVVCATGDAAETAISYGRYCAVVYPLVGVIHSIMRVRRRGENVRVRCDFSGEQADTATYHIMLSVRVFRVLAVLLHIVIAEIKRRAQREQEG